MPPRQVFEAIVYVLRTGCQWKALPQTQFGSPSSIHKYFLAWKRAGVFVRLWRKGLAEYDELEGIAWWWQSVDAALVKAPLAQEAVGPNPTDRGKKGTKRSLLVDGRGIPLSILVSGAERHDVRLLEPTLDRVVCRRPRRGRRQPARRWVAERIHSWLNRFRKLLVRFEKREVSYDALLELACAMIVYRQVIVTHGEALIRRRLAE